MVPVVEPDARSTTDTEFPLVTQAVCVSGSTAAPAGALPTSTGAVRDSASTRTSLRSWVVLSTLGWIQFHTLRLIASTPTANPTARAPLAPPGPEQTIPSTMSPGGLSSLVTDIVSPQPLT
ncbi:MAG: hypothetical protein QOI25_389 [Mycobacterium sp.]|nr:hypothetical protein [Mycobacterium sp.]